MSKKLWVEHYRPKNMSEYVFCTPEQKQQIASWIKTGSIPHILLYGGPGTGKTSCAFMLFSEIDVDPADILTINGSSQNGVETIRDTITNFVSTMPFGEFRYVFIDEGDYLSPNAQAALRNLMETFSNSARFVITCNYPNKIIPALHSRCQALQIEKLNKNDYTVRIAEILANESVEFDIDTLDSFVDASYPDMRKCINMVQQNSTSGKLTLPDVKTSTSSDYKIAAIALFKQGKYKDGRQLICQQARPEEYEEIFTFMYQNLDLWAKNEDQENEAIVIIRNGLAKAPLCADPEINLSATLVELSLISR